MSRPVGPRVWASERYVEGVIFLDVNTFLSPRGGGIRTYHQRKSDWFAGQDSHRYLTLQPGPRREVLPETRPHVERHAARGLPIGDNYRFLWDLGAGNDLLESRKVDVVEAGDPWATAVWASRLDGPLRASFWHSDPHTAYIGPLTAKLLPGIGKLVARLVQGSLDRTHRKFHVVWCASRWVRDLQLARGVAGAELMPFGIGHADFQPQAPDPSVISGLGLDPERPVLLYAGRLDVEKGTDVLERAIPDLLSLESRPQIVVAGRGERQDRFRRISAGGFRFVGFLEDPARLRALYASSTLLLSPCAVETFGLGVLESLHMGLPVISADGGGGGEQVADSRGGELFEPGDARELVLAVARGLARRRELSRRAMLWGAAWPSWERMFELQTERLVALRERQLAGDLA